MKYVLKYVQNERTCITEQLLDDIKTMQRTSAAIDTKPIQDKIDCILRKKHNAIDLMLEGIISKDDLKTQVDIYDAEINKLTTQISNNKDIDAFHRKQLDGIKAYIEQINRTKDVDITSFEVYNSMLKKIVVHGNNLIDFYLICVPFGFHLHYLNERIPHTHNKFAVTVDSCEIISE